MRFHRGIYLSELVGDFIKDEEGNWWFIDIKVFKYDEKFRILLIFFFYLLMLG